MNEILEQIVARSRGPDWENILFIVFLAIVWAIGGILKAKKSAQEKRSGRQALGQKPGIKPGVGKKETPKGPFQQIRDAVVAELEKQRELQKQAQQAKRKMVRPKPAVRKVSPQAERTAKTPTFEPVKEKVLPTLTVEAEPKIEILPEITDKTITKVRDKRRAAVSRQLPQSRYLSEIVTAYSDPDELRRAILHYEILGKPLSLRDPTGHIIGL
jgi:hypothetical protein